MKRNSRAKFATYKYATIQRTYWRTGGEGGGDGVTALPPNRGELIREAPPVTHLIRLRKKQVAAFGVLGARDLLRKRAAAEGRYIEHLQYERDVESRLMKRRHRRGGVLASSEKRN